MPKGRPFSQPVDFRCLNPGDRVSIPDPMNMDDVSRLRASVAQYQRRHPDRRWRVLTQFLASGADAGMFRVQIRCVPPGWTEPVLPDSDAARARDSDMARLTELVQFWREDNIPDPGTPAWLASGMRTGWECRWREIRRLRAKVLRDALGLQRRDGGAALMAAQALLDTMPAALAAED